MKIKSIPVANATKPINLIITKKDVRLAKDKDPAHCVAARACVRQMGCAEARIHLARTYIRVANRWLRFKTSKALRSEIIAFDRGGKFEPGEYQLQPLTRAEIKQLGSQQGSRDKTDRNKRRKKRLRAAPHIIHGVRQHGAIGATKHR